VILKTVWNINIHNKMYGSLWKTARNFKSAVFLPLLCLYDVIDDRRSYEIWARMFWHKMSVIYCMVLKLVNHWIVCISHYGFWLALWYPHIFRQSNSSFWYSEAFALVFSAFHIFTCPTRFHFLINEYKEIILEKN
jgi:hypothetical protein